MAQTYSLQDVVGTPKKYGLEDVAPPSDQSWLDRQSNGLATGPINAYLGIKQLFGGLDPIEQDVLRQNRNAEKNAPGASVLSNIGMLAPTMLIPGANTIAAGGVIGSLQGLAQPADGEQSFANIAKQKLINMGLGGVFGTAGQYVGGKVASTVSQNLADQTASAAANASRNSVRDATLEEARLAGYTVPNSAVNPTFMGNRLESLGGKAAIKQESTIRNQDVTNALARKAIGLPEDAPLSVGNVEKQRTANYGPYQDVAALPPRPLQLGSSVTNTTTVEPFNPAQALQDLKQSRNDAQGFYTFYNRSGDPSQLALAKAAESKANSLEFQLQQHATVNGRPDLVPALVDARKQIAKTYMVERALNPANGDINPQVLGRLYAKGKPLSDGLDTIGKFTASYPQFSKPSSMTPAAGVTAVEPMAMAAMAATTGDPLAGLLPLLRSPARSLALAKFMQSNPKYPVSKTLRLIDSIPGNAAGLLGRSTNQALIPYASGLLTAE